MWHCENACHFRGGWTSSFENSGHANHMSCPFHPAVLGATLPWVLPDLTASAGLNGWPPSCPLDTLRIHLDQTAREASLLSHPQHQTDLFRPQKAWGGRFGRTAGLGAKLFFEGKPNRSRTEIIWKGRYLVPIIQTKMTISRISPFKLKEASFQMCHSFWNKKRENRGGKRKQWQK